LKHSHRDAIMLPEYFKKISVKSKKIKRREVDVNEGS